MDGQDDKKQANIDFSPEGPQSSSRSSLEGAGDKAKASLSKDATESQETSKGKKAEQVFKADVPKLDPSGMAPAPETITRRPSNILDLVQPTDRVSTVAPAPEAQGPSGNWNSASFVSPLPMLNEATQASSNENLPLAFQKLADAQAAVDLLTPANVRIILNDLENLKRDLPHEMDSIKRAQMQDRIQLGTQLLDSRWECPLRLAMSAFQMGAKDGQAPADAYRLLQEAAKIHPELRDDPTVKQAIESVASLYGNMSQAVKQSMEQAVFSGVQVAGQTPQERSAFQTDPTLAAKLAEQGHKAQLDSPDPYVHAREAEQQMKAKGVLDQDARKAHDRGIELAKKVKNTQGESYNSILSEINLAKKDVLSKQESVAKLAQEIEALKKQSKAITQEVAVISAERAKEVAKGHSANMLESVGAIFNQTVKQWNGEAEKENKAYEGKVAALVKVGNELKKLEAQRKTLDSEIKTGQDSIKGKQAKLTEIGKPITEKHVEYAKALLKDATVRADEVFQARAEGNKDAYETKKALQMIDILTAAQQLSRAEKISPELANDAELKALKQQFSIVTTSISDKVKDLTPDQQQDMDDRFLALVNGYNQKHSDKLQQAIAAGAKPTDFQAELQKQLTGLKTVFPELKAVGALTAASSLIGKAELITDEALAQEVTVESKALKLQTNLDTAKQSMQDFEALMGAKQYKDAEEAFKTYSENRKSLYATKKESLAEIDKAMNSCKTIEEVAQLRLAKQALEANIAQDEEKILTSIGALYLTPPEYEMPQKDGTKVKVTGPGFKPEQAAQALAQAKEAFPGIENHPLYQEELKATQQLQKGVKDMEIKAREDAEHLKEAGIDLTASLTSWGAAAAAGVGATALCVGTGLMIAGAPVTVPAALAIVGITAATGALVGGLTKAGLATALDAENKDFYSNFGKGALIGGTSGLGGGGLKVGGMVLSEGLALSKAGNTVFQGVKYASVYDKVSKVTPMSENVAVMLKGANGNVAKEIEIGEKILEGHLKSGKITQSTYNGAKSWLSGEGVVNKADIQVAEILKSAGITMGEDALTAAGLKMYAVQGASGTKVIDAGYAALKAGAGPANNLAQAGWNPIAHVANFGKSRMHDLSSLGTRLAYAAPYTLGRTALAGTALGSASAYYNANKYYGKVANGEINEATGEKWTSDQAWATGSTNAAFETGLGLVGMGAIRGISTNPTLAAAAADVKTGGLASMTNGAIWLGNKFTRGGLGRAGAKLGENNAFASAMSKWSEGMLHDNTGVAAPFVRHILPLGVSTGRQLVLAEGQSVNDENYLVTHKSELANAELAPAAEQTQVAEAQEQAKPAQGESTEQGTQLAEKPAAPQQTEVADAGTEEKPVQQESNESGGPSLSVTDS